MTPYMRALISLFLVFFSAIFFLGGSLAVAADKKIEKSFSDKEIFEAKIEELMSVYKDDTKSNGFRPGSVKIDMAARKKYFTEQGWTQYQAYVKEMRRPSNQPGDAQGKEFYSVNGALNARSIKYSYWLGKYYGFYASGKLRRYLSFDLDTDGPEFTIEVKFLRRKYLTPESNMIDTWRVNVDYPKPFRSRHLYKNKNPFLEFTCKLFDIGCV